MVLLIGPYACRLFRICIAYADLGCCVSCTLHVLGIFVLKFDQSVQHMNVYMQNTLVRTCDSVRIRFVRHVFRF
jgi:hypothetical protein